MTTLERILPDWSVITAWGGTPLMASVAVLCLGWLISQKQYRAATAWVVAIVVALGLVTVSKLLFIGWGIGIASLNFTGFSGHATRAAMIAPMALYMIFSPERVRFQWLVFIAGAVFGVLISWSRLEVHAHSPAEVVSGLLLGLCAGGWAISRINVGSSRQHRYGWVLLVAIICMTPLTSGVSVPAESWLQKIALGMSGHTQPFVRVYPLQDQWSWIYPVRQDSMHM